MNQDQDIELIADGKRARIATEVFGTMLKKREGEAYRRMLQLYHSGEMEFHKYLVEIGKMASYDEMLRDLDSITKRGEKAAERQLNP